MRDLETTTSSTSGTITTGDRRPSPAALPTDPLFIITFSAANRGLHFRDTGTHEMDMDRMTKSLIVSDICDGQFPNLDRIIEVHPDTRPEDVTEEIAQAVADQLRSEYRAPSYELATWLQTVLGVNSSSVAAE